MKKFISLFMAFLMLASLVACTNAPAGGDDNKEQTAGNILLADFYEKAGELSTALEIAEAVSKNSILPFSAMTMEVEPGWLNGFDADILGFSEGAVFAPAISTIPFIGYVFVLESEDDTDDFIKTLEENANLRWNVCTEAEEAVSGSLDNKVFFVMTNKAFEEE